MNEFGPNRTVPVEEWATSPLDEELLLQQPVDNAGKLYDLYEARARLHLERVESGVDSAVRDIIAALERARIMSTLLPSDDPRSYEAWKKKYCAPAKQ